MIEKLMIKDVASYDNNGIEINFNKINYIFGSNGTGKTTISEYLRNINNPKYASCEIKWKEESSDIEVFVYNKHFVNENFGIRNEIKGIFTLGKESKEVLESIDETKKEIEKHRHRIEKVVKNIKQKEEQIKNLHDSFSDQCWSLKQKYDVSFKEAFTGLRNKKEKFMERFLIEAENCKGKLYSYEELKNRVNTVFRSSGEKVDLIPDVQYNNSIEVQPIFKTKIIGKEDLDIAKLISKLNISDWVREGHRHMKFTNGICPFCQQELQKDFKKKLDQYFDETYTKQLENLRMSIEKYKREINNFFEGYKFLLEKDNTFINKDKINSLFELIKSRHKENIQLLETKLNEPSRSIKLNSIGEYIDILKSEIKQANFKISEFNSVIDNLKEEKRVLIEDIWRFVIEENKSNYKFYKENFMRENKALEGMKKNKRELEQYKRKHEDELIKLQNKLTSVLPSINEINNLLRSFGFTNFQLAESNEEGNYKIVRENGEDANETLSEGEKTFITFLYFYQLIFGSNDQSKVNTPRVIVIDDPISSLDSNILFIVSNLINQLKQRIRNKDSVIKQLIILTHNVYFHKEITFNKRRDRKRVEDETYWILRKANNISFIKNYQENPIKNSYELLWKELKENQDSITTPNIMRRILENYFKFFGNIDIHEIIETFRGDDKIVCRSLLSWINDGSHYVNDDLYIDSNTELNKQYFDVFKRIFINSNHQSHYEMMMGESQFIDFKLQIENEGLNELQIAKEQVATSKE